MAASAQADTFYSRASGQAVYDATTNLTWITNTDLIQNNTFGITIPTNTPYTIGLGVQSDGSMDLATAQNWINAMNAVNYLGYNGWRLPETPYLGCLGANCTDSEMGYLNYYGLGGAGSNSFNIGPFQNMIDSEYWSTPCGQAACLGQEWVFAFGSGGGYQAYVFPNQMMGIDNNGNTIWGYSDAGTMVVATGDVLAAPSPEPANYALMLAGIVLVVFAPRRKRVPLYTRSSEID